MKIIKFILLIVVLFAFCVPGNSQIRKKNKNETAAKDSSATKPTGDSVAVVTVDTTLPKKDTIAPVVVAKPDTTFMAVPKDCFQDWYEKIRARGAKPVTDGMHPVIITLKNEEACVCLVGQIEVANGKMKAPLMVQQEDEEFKPFNAIGKKLDPVFASTMTEDQMLTVTDGMSVLFRTTSQEYGRIIFYTFANKSSKANKAAPSPDELLKDE